MLDRVRDVHLGPRQVRFDECAAEETARTSPFDYVSTIIFPGCASNCNDTTDCAKTNCGLVTCVEDPSADPPVVTWENDCTHQNCYGVPLYRQYVTKDEKAKGINPSIRMMGQNVGQRSTLTVNHGKYYVDTTPRRTQQIAQTGINAVNTGFNTSTAFNPLTTTPGPFGNGMPF